MIPIRYLLTLDSVNDVRACYTTDLDLYPTGNLIVRFEMAREDWIYQDRPTRLYVAVSAVEES